IRPLDSRTFLPAGSELQLDVTLIGCGVDSFAHFLVVFEEMGRSGRYGGRLRSVRSALLGSALIFDGFTRRVASVVPEWWLERGDRWSAAAENRSRSVVRRRPDCLALGRSK